MVYCILFYSVVIEDHPLTVVIDDSVSSATLLAYVGVASVSPSDRRGADNFVSSVLSSKIVPVYVLCARSCVSIWCRVGHLSKH